MLPTFTGLAVYTEKEKFQKITFEEVDKGKASYPKNSDDGWIAVIQHYFLGAWVPKNGTPREFYVRQLADMKGSVKFSEHGAITREGFIEYCGLCGWALALAHAKSGDPAMIAGYCGNSAALDEAIGRFAMVYAKQTERDHAALEKARRTGRIKVASAVK